MAPLERRDVARCRAETIGSAREQAPRDDHRLVDFVGIDHGAGEMWQITLKVEPATLP
jgi:hypothetical protein